MRLTTKTAQHSSSRATDALTSHGQSDKSWVIYWKYENMKNWNIENTIATTFDTRFKIFDVPIRASTARTDFRASTARTASRHFTRKHFTTLVFTVCALDKTSSIQYHVRVKSGQMNQTVNNTNQLLLLRCKNWVPAVESIGLCSNYYHYSSRRVDEDAAEHNNSSSRACKSR